MHNDFTSSCYRMMHHDVAADLLDSHVTSTVVPSALWPYAIDLPICNQIEVTGCRMSIGVKDVLVQRVEGGMPTPAWQVLPLII